MHNGYLMLRVLFENSVTAKGQELEFYSMWEMDSGNHTPTVYNLNMGREKREREGGRRKEKANKEYQV